MGEEEMNKYIEERYGHIKYPECPMWLVVVMSILPFALAIGAGVTLKLFG